MALVEVFRNPLHRETLHLGAKRLAEGDSYRHEHHQRKPGGERGPQEAKVTQRLTNEGHHREGNARCQANADG